MVCLTTPRGLTAQSTEEEDDDDGDDDEEDSDDGSEEEEEDDMRVQIAKHKQQLAQLQEQDPEFYAYMKQEGTDLMEFGADVDTADLDGKELAPDDDDEDDSDSGSGEPEDGEEQPGGQDDDEDETPPDPLQKAQSGKKPLAMETLNRWEDAAKKGKLAAVNSLLKAFDAAVVLLVDDQTGPARKGAKAAKKQKQAKNMAAVKRFKFKIESGDVFDALLVCMTREMPTILMDELLGRPTSAVDGGEDDGRPASAKWKPQRSNKWRELAKPVGTYCRNMLTLLQAVTDTDMMSWVLRAVSTSLPLISAVPKIPRELLKIVLTLWATGGEAVRARSFIVIHKLCAADPKRLLPLTLKGMYLTYVRHTKTSNPSALPRVNFFVACITDIFGMDMELSYQHAFVSIRQLAVTLRTALTGKTREATNSVCCWPFVNAVRCWGQVLGRYPGEAELGLLIYPYTQLVLGSIKIASTAPLYPMRFLLIRFLTHVASMPRVGNYIPLAPYLLEVLDNPAFKGGKSSGNRKADIKPPPIEHVLKVSKQVVQSRLYQQQVVTTACDLLAQTFGPVAYSISFPELALPAILRLKKFSKETAVGNFRKAAAMSASHLTRNSTWVEELREECGYELLKPAKLGGVALREMETVVARKGKARGGDTQRAPLDVYLKQRDAIASKAESAAESSAKSVTFEGDETPGQSKQTKKKKKGVAAENAYLDEEDDDEEDDDDVPEVDPEVAELAAAVAAEGENRKRQKKQKDRKGTKKKAAPTKQLTVDDVMEMEDEVANVDMEDL
eukprot:COSAG02_NODE_2341_length_9104_cov_2.666185_9_plen_785_part_00